MDGEEEEEDEEMDDDGMGVGPGMRPPPRGGVCMLELSGIPEEDSANITRSTLLSRSARPPPPGACVRACVSVLHLRDFAREHRPASAALTFAAPAGFPSTDISPVLPRTRPSDSSLQGDLRGVRRP